LHDRPTTLSALHEALCAGSTERLASLTLESPAVETIERSDRCEVAIIGMSCIFPKAGDLRSYWENILNSVYAITEVPADRWDWRRYFDADPNARDKIYSRWGGFIDPIVFDPMRFGIPPMSMKSVDPLQLFPLEVTRRALADAGYLDREYDKSRTGVFFGVAGGMGEWGLMYGFRSVLSLFLDHVPEELLSQLPEWTEDSFAGVLANVVAGRIANNFDFGGPNFTVDAACGSGLTAVYTGVNQIASGTCDMAVVGASDVMQNPFGFLCFSKSRALSPLGRPRPFDAGADGIAIGEGIAVVVLKRRDLAERDGDRMYAVIRGVGAGGDGRGASMTAPQTRGQMRAFDRAYQQAGFSIDSIELVEAHGTGTTLGDGVEARSLQEAQCEAGARARTCAVGSVKSMIGHTKGCAGIAGVIKSALALHYKVLPPTMGVDTPSPAECWGKDSPIYVNTETRPWIKSAGIRRAGVDAFGFGGSNFHVVLEEAWPGDEPTAFPMATWPCELFCWCAASGTALQEALRGFRVKLDAAEGATLKDLSALVTQTALAAPTEGVRVALVAETREDLTEKIDAVLKALADGVESIKDPRGIYYSAKPARRDGRVAFVFPGQGSQRPDMLRDLAVLFPEVRERFTMADRVTQGCYAKPLSEFVYPPPRFSPAEEKQCMSELTVTHVAQPALAAASMSLMHIWELLGVRPEMTAGHSVAEYAALCAAGVFDEETLYDILEYRGRCIVESCKGDMGTMLAVKGGVDDVAALVEKFDDVHVANLNSPTQTILSGRKGDLEQVTASLAKQGIKSRPIPVSCAFHSPFVEPARKALAERLASMTFHSPAMPVYSNTLGGMYPPDQDDMRSILAEQLVKSVRFTEEIDAMYEAGARIFVEVGPGNVMTNLVKQILGDRPHVVVACDAKSPRHDLFQLLHAVAELVSEGVGVKPGVLFDRRTVAELSPETLRPTAAAEKLSPVSWMLGPDRAWPLSESKPVRRPISLAAAPAAGAVPGKAPGMGSIPPPAATDDPKRAEALVRYQKLMNEFLEQQRDVMLAFLGDGSAPLSVPSVAGATAIAAPTPPAAVPEPLTAPAASVPEPKATGSLMQLLVDIVSERTGYPPEMLDQDLDMEADLGIDSIKRVEILTVFGKRVPNPPPDLAERLGVTRTLRQVMETVGEVANAAPDAPQAAPAAPSGDMTAALVGLVSERTGYPPEMLDLDLDMEADLGIDSIKRVEILTAFGKTVPSPPADLAERMGTARTLQQVLDMLLSGAAGGPATAADETAPETPGAAAAPARIERGLVELHEAPLTGKGNTVLPDGVVLVTDDGKGCAAALCRRIAELGGEAVLLSLDAPTEATDTVQLDLADAQAVETFVDGLREERGAIGGVVHLLPLRDTPQFPDFDAALWQKHVNEEIKGLFNLLRFTACDLKQSNRKWALACTSLGTESSNGHLPHPSRPWRGGIMGLMKSLAAEWGETLCKVLDVDQPVPDLLVDWILNELARARDDHEVYYLRKTRWVPSVSSVPIVPGEHSPAIERDDVILIIGGARGITAEIAREIATTARPTIVLAGRSPWPGEESDVTAAAQNEAGLKKALFEHMRADGGQPRPIEVEQACRRILMDRQMKATRQALESAGSRVAYIRADVQDPDDFARLLAEIEKTYGRLDGVVNGAGVIEDKLLEEKDPQSFARVFDIKAMSVFLMGRLLKPESLKFVVLFSSVAGWFGNPGQTDYAAANEVMNRMSMYLSRQWGRRVVAVNWGPWAASGMVSDGVAAQFRARGLELVDPAAGRRYLLDELAGGRPDDALVIAYGAPG